MDPRRLRRTTVDAMAVLTVSVCPEHKSGLRRLCGVCDGGRRQSDFRGGQDDGLSVYRFA